jgi:hypothetical protein
VGWGGEIRVPQPALATFAEHEFLAVFRQVGHGIEIDPLVAALELDRLLDRRRVALVDHRARRDLGDHRVAALPGLAHAAAVDAFLGDQLRVVVELPEIVGGRVDHQDDVAALPAIAAIRAAAGHELFAAEGDGSVPAVASFGEDADVIDEHGARKVRGGRGEVNAKRNASSGFEHLQFQRGNGFEMLRVRCGKRHLKLHGGGGDQGVGRGQPVGKGELFNVNHGPVARLFRDRHRLESQVEQELLRQAELGGIPRALEELHP